MTKTTRHYTFVGLQVVVGLLLFALFLSLYKYAETLLYKQCDEMATRDLERIELTIDRELGKVENAAHLLAQIEFGNGLNIPRTEEAIYHILEEFVSAAQQPITGAILGFEDEVFPQYASRNGFLPLVRKTTEGLRQFQVGEIRDVRMINDWYATTKLQDKERWSKAQFSEEGAEISCYCIPLHNREGRFIGVLALDCSLDDLSQEVCAIRSYPNAEPLITDDDFTIVAAIDRNLILKETMYSMLQNRGLQIDPVVERDIKMHRDGKHHMLQGNYQTPHEVFFYYCTEPHAGWTIQMACPAEEIRQDLAALRTRMGITAALILLMIILVALTYIQRKE